MLNGFALAASFRLSPGFAAASDMGMARKLTIEGAALEVVEVLAH